jgi:hypothetical protein
MHKPDPIESILARLMPPALSEDGQYEIESMLDTLAGIPAALPPAKSSGMAWMRRIITGGIAATGVSAALIFPLATPPAPSSWAVVAPAAAESANDAPAGLVLVSESDRIESMTDEGWQEDADGSTMQVLRLYVVEENSRLDEETGIIIQVSEPREEILLMPVNTF